MHGLPKQQWLLALKLFLRVQPLRQPVCQNRKRKQQFIVKLWSAKTTYNSYFKITVFDEQIINNYWTRLSKISWFVSGERINYLPMPKAEANNWSARHWQITIFCEIEFNNCFIIQQDNVFMHLTSTLVSQLFIPTPSARFHSVQNFNILHKKYKISKFRFRQ